MSSFRAIMLGLAVTAAAMSLNATVLYGPVTNSVNHHAYYLLTQSTWPDAEAEAESMGGHLATIADLAEHNFVYTNFASIGGTNRHLWIGLQRAGNSFFWVTGEPLVFTHWSPGEPNNCDGIEDSGMIFAPFPDYIASAGYWNDVSQIGYGGCGGGYLGPFGVVEVELRMSIVVSAVDVCWYSVSNHNYQVEYLSNAQSNQWTALGSPVLATGGKTCITDFIRDHAQRFYRVYQTD